MKIFLGSEHFRSLHGGHLGQCEFSSEPMQEVWNLEAAQAHREREHVTKSEVPECGLKNFHWDQGGGGTWVALNGVLSLQATPNWG